MKIKSYKKEINENGYVVIKNLIQKKQINEILNGFESIVDYSISLISKNKKFNNLSQKYIWLQKKNNKLKSKTYDISQFHPSLFKVIFNKKLNLILNGYFEKKPIVDYPCLKIQDFLNKRLLPMHQDVYGMLSSKSLILWLALTDVSKINGTLGLIKGSHKNGRLKHKFYTSNNFKAHGVLKKFYKDSQITAINLKKGDAVLFHPHIIHGSVNNKSKKIRMNYIVRFSEISGIEYLNDMKSKSLKIAQL